MCEVALSPKSLEVNPCNFNRWEHGGWDLSLHTGPKSLEVDPCDLSRWEHGSWDLPLPSWSKILGLKHDMDTYMATVVEGEVRWGEVWDLCWEWVGWSKKLDPTLSTNPTRFCAKSNLNPTLLNVSHILMVSWGSKVGTLCPCWNLQPWVGLGSWDLMWAGPSNQQMELQQHDFLSNHYKARRRWRWWVGVFDKKNSRFNHLRAHKKGFQRSNSCLYHIYQYSNDANKTTIITKAFYFFLCLFKIMGTYQKPQLKLNQKVWGCRNFMCFFINTRRSGNRAFWRTSTRVVWGGDGGLKELKISPYSHHPASP